MVSKRKREAGDPGRLCAKRDRWLEPLGGLATALPFGKGMPVGEVRGLDGLGHLEDGSGHTGLRGCILSRGLALSFSLDAAFESTGDGVMALRCSVPLWLPGLGVCFGVEGREDDMFFVMGSGS